MAMKYKPYPTYKDSGIPWLGEVPAGWEVIRLKHNFRLLTQKTDRRENPVALENIQSWLGRFIPTETEFEGEGIAFERGDILFGKLRPYLAKAFLAETAGEAVGDFFVMRPTSDVNGRFALYQILNKDFISIVDGSTFGAKMPRASWEFMSGMVLAMPTQDEQSAIATFLDRETAKIDTLIAKQEHLIELLQEKRTALISHAVTKGLNPDVPMKDSGVEWLGEVPGHWEVSQLRRYILFITSGSRGWAEHYVESGSIFIRIGNLTRDSINIDLTDVQHVQPPTGSEGERTAIKESDILFSITAYLGSVAVAGREIEGAYVSQHVALVRVDTSLIYPRFMAYMMLSDGGKNQLQGSAYGGTKVQLGLDDVREIWIPVPFLEEQKAIATFLDRETTKIDTLIQKSRHAIDLLKERRTALISAAVTGKIDVRDRV